MFFFYMKIITYSIVSAPLLQVWGHASRRTLWNASTFCCIFCLKNVQKYLFLYKKDALKAYAYFFPEQESNLVTVLV